jgi:hypothetical protein
MDTAYNQSSNDYIPKSDSAVRDWLRNFASLIAANPNKYALTAADAAVLTSTSDAYSSAYDTAVAPSTRTSSNIADKDSQRAAAIGTARTYAQMIRATGAISNEDKIALGLRPANLSRTPIPAPRTAPLIMITGARSGTHELRYADTTTPNSRRKPPGAIQLQLSMVEGDAPATNPDAAKLVGLYTKQPVIVEHDATSNGKTATYFARWVTRRGLLGPWSLPVS